MSIDNCVEKISKAMRGRNLAKNDIKRLLKELDEEAKSLAGQDGDYASSLREVGRQFNEHIKRQAREEKRRNLLQMKTRQQIKSKIDGYISQGADPADAMIMAIVGLDDKSISGSMASTASKQVALSTRYANQFAKALEAKGVLDVFRLKDESSQLNILKALEQLNTKGAEKPTGVYGEIAEIYNAHLSVVRKRLRDAGVDTRDLDGFAMSQTHEAGLIKSAGKDGWINYIKENDLLDYNKIFRTDKYTELDVNRFLENTYEALSSGVRKKQTADVADDAGARIKRPSNVADRLSQSRVLHFKDTEAFFKYNQEFGSGSVQETISSSLWQGGQNIALLEDWGPNPRSNFERVIRELSEKYRDDEKILKGLTGKGFFQKVRGRDIEALFNNVDGTAFIAESVSSARMHQNIRGWVSMAKLGGATISAISDIPIIADTLALNGLNVAKGYSKGFSNAVNRVPKEKRGEFASMVDTYAEVTVGSVANRFGLFDDVPGKMQEGLRLFYKLNGLQWWTNAQKEGVSAALTNHLALNKGVKFEELAGGLKENLKNYNIDETDWGLLSSAEMAEVNGREFMTSDVVNNISDADLGKALGITDLDDSRILKYRRELEDKLNMYLIDTVNSAVITPGARERAIQNFGYPPGSAVGELIRTAMLFKSFPATFMVKHLGARARNKDNVNLAHLIIGMTAFGGVAMSAKMVMRGEDPMALFDRASEDKSIAVGLGMAMMVQGGGLGIFGDFAFGGQNRYGQSFTETLAGPVYGDMLSSALSIPGNLVDLGRGEIEPETLAANMVKKAKSYIPGQNLPYIAPMGNLVVYEMQEFLNPGYLRRMENRKERERGITYITEPIDMRPSSMVD